MDITRGNLEELAFNRGLDVLEKEQNELEAEIEQHVDDPNSE